MMSQKYHLQFKQLLFLYGWSVFEPFYLHHHRHRENLVQLCWVNYINYVSPFLSILGQILWLLHLFRSIFTTSNLGPLRPTPFLKAPSTCIQKLFYTSVIGGLRWTCPNHLKQVPLNLSPIDAPPKCSQVRSFLILSFLVLPRIHHNILISTTLSFCMFCFLIDHHSTP